jgi:hypothetical protein
MELRHHSAWKLRRGGTGRPNQTVDFRHVTVANENESPLFPSLFQSFRTFNATSLGQLARRLN